VVHDDRELVEIVLERGFDGVRIDCAHTDAPAVRAVGSADRDDGGGGHEGRRRSVV
jgi:hypothetical protein